MQSQDALLLPHPKYRRSRVPLSCEPCRARKLKCNREAPCQNCTTRGEHAKCKFRGAGSGPVPTARGSSADAMRQRIDHLEDLVKRLAAERLPVSPPSSHHTVATRTAESSDAETGLTCAPTTPDSQDKSGVGSTVMEGVHSVYLGGDDWHVVLQEINELRQAWNQEQINQNDYDLNPAISHMVDGSSLLFNQIKPIDRIEILSSLPPKSTIDKLVSQFFDHETFPIMIPPILHKETFMREYAAHWVDPSRTNFMWLGLLFSILGITMLAYYQNEEPPEFEGRSESLFQLYRMRTAQCVLSGDIAKCLPYTVEVLRFNATAELNRNDDNRRGLWIMTGVLVRTAINMGYHRDPSQLPGMPPLQAELRRRAWLSVNTMENMASFLGGFPRLMWEAYSDTMEPRNLHDWELSESMTALPPSRPLTERTPATYPIVKGRLFRALGRVADFNNTPNADSYETVLEIDRAIEKAYQEFPSYMKVARIEEYEGAVPNATYFSNLSLSAMYHKGMCTLHRRFSTKARVDVRFKLSQDRCISSSLALLAYQPGLKASYYKISETRQMFSLAAMILFLELDWRRKTPDAVASPESEHLLKALEQSCSLWAKAMVGCDEARKYHDFLVSMLMAYRNGTSTGVELLGGVSPAISVHYSGYSQVDDELFGDRYLANMDFDWAGWDAFTDEINHEAGPVY